MYSGHLYTERHWEHCRECRVPDDAIEITPEREALFVQKELEESRRSRLEDLSREASQGPTHRCQIPDILTRLCDNLGAPFWARDDSDATLLACADYLTEQGHEEIGIAVQSVTRIIREQQTLYDTLVAQRVDDVKEIRYLSDTRRRCPVAYIRGDGGPSAKLKRSGRCYYRGRLHMEVPYRVEVGVVWLARHRGLTIPPLTPNPLPEIIQSYSLKIKQITEAVAESARRRPATVCT
jgi:hypothetical protein